MCGIAGLVCITPTCGEDGHRSLVERMCTLQRHRGPDDTGVELLGDVALGSVRLKILDLSQAGRMPMSDPSGRWWIVYNGEVYNFEALRRELSELGHSFRSRTDTEVVLHAFIEWGVASLERFTGMFAFAVYDREEDALTLVRDRFGIKPLYTLEHAGHVLFASEIKALVQVVDGLQVDRQSMVEWALYQNVDALTPETLVDGVQSVLPGHFVTIRGGERVSESYYSPPRRVEPAEFERFARLTQAEVVEEIETALRQSVADRLVSDVPVGTLLSGGVDSGLVTSIAAREREGLTAFHVSVPGYADLDERALAEETARGLGIELVCHALDGASFRRELPRVIHQSDVPLTHANSVAYSLICRVARERGVIVLLSGEGADELFGGYSWRYRRLRNVLRAQRFLRRLPRKLYKGLELAGYASAGLPVNSHRFDELLPQAVDFIDRYARRAWSLECEEAYAFVRSPLDRALLGAMLGDLADFLSPLLRRLDRMSMGASVECRVPFLDHRLVEQAIHLPLLYRVGKRSDKWILRRVAERYLPRAAAGRRKLGFPLPLREWLAPLAAPGLFEDGFCQETLGLRRRGLAGFLAAWERTPTAFLGLLSCELWGRLFFRREPLEQLDALIEDLERAHARR